MRSFIKWFLIICGIGILVYPSLSQFLISRNASRAIAHYDESIAVQDEKSISEEINKIDRYNEAVLSGSLPSNYLDILNPGKTGMMGYVVIPSLGSETPVFHGTGKEVLTKGAGHVEGSSFPSDKKNVHCVIAGHSGLSTANLFTGLDKLKEGDIFLIKFLNKTYKYKIDDIQVVLPEKTEELVPVKEKNYVTLVTCVPYGINSHRLLVRGEFEGKTDENSLKSESKQKDAELSLRERLINMYYKIPIQYRHLGFGLGGILLVLLIKIIWNIPKKRHKKTIKEHT